MSISLCVGEYATTPYRVPGVDVPIHCLEELCFVIKENAFLLDESLMNRELTDFLESKLGEKELGKELWKMCSRQSPLTAFCGALLEYTGLYTAKEIRQVLSVLEGSEGLTGLEKQKKQADFLLDRRKYNAAIHGYNSMLDQWNEAGAKGEYAAPSVKAAIHHNKGVALAGLMLYEAAAECFLEAYSLEGKREECMAYLAAKRMSLSEEEYIRFVSSHSEFFEETLELERNMEQIRESYAGSVANAMLAERKSNRIGMDKQTYYQDNDKLPQYLKNSYRNYVSE